MVQPSLPARRRLLAAAGSAALVASAVAQTRSARTWEDIWRREAVSVRDHGAPADGRGDASAAIRAADVAAGKTRPLIFVPGTYLITASHSFVATVVMMPGAVIRVDDPRVSLRFAAGFLAGLHHCLDTDGPTQFLSIEKVYPQWFGSCGGGTEDSSQALSRAFRACRASFDAKSDKTDKTLGCRTVWFASGTYRCRNVVVYAGTNIDGEWGGSPYGPTLMQIDYKDPGLRFVPKNYGLSDELLNTSVGQNHIHNVRLGSETPASTFDGKPVCYFMSPAQATAYLRIPGDHAGGDVGHIDTQFVQTWWKHANTCIQADDGMLWLHVRDSTFDVVYRAVQHTGKARGFVRSYNNIYYACIWGALENTSGETRVGVGWNSFNDEFKAGTPVHAVADKRRSLNYNPAVWVAGTVVKIAGSTFLRQDSQGFRIGGPVFVNNADTVDIDFQMKDPDSSNNQKAVHIGAGVRSLRLSGTIQSDELSSYRNARLVSITQEKQTLGSARVAIQFINNNRQGEIEAAVHSDYPLDELDLGGSTFRGAMQKELGPNVRRPRGYTGPQGAAVPGGR